MEILRTISLYAESKGMAFLLIGGHAVNAYGISRQTGDLDLLVPLAAKELWRDLLSKLKYSEFQCDDRFARYNPSDLAAWPIDLMFVDEATFRKLSDSSELIPVGVAQVRVVSARHLAILKIHALKIFQSQRFNKDFTDLASLLRSGKTGISDQELLELCLRYASSDLYDRLKQEL